MHLIIAPLQSAWNYLSNEWSFIPIGLRTRELRPFYFGVASCPRLISEYVTPKDLVVTSCAGLLKCWFLMHWKLDLMEHLNIPFVHLWTCASWWKQQCSLRDFGGVDDLDFSFYHELMGVIHHACKITIKHKVPPRWQSGILTLCQQTMTSLRSSLVA
jgi:hypothetical protein